MRRLLWLIVALVMLCGVSLAEQAPVADLAPYAGLWCSVGANDTTPYITLHADGTMEAYDYTSEEQGEHRTVIALRYSGAYTFDEGGFRFPYDERAYAVYTEPLGWDCESSDMKFEFPEGATSLCFVTEPVEAEGYEYDPSCYYVPVDESRTLLPTEQDMTGEWFVYGEAEEITPYISLREDGTATLREGGEAAYTLDNGRLTLTADGATRTLYLTYTMGWMDELDENASEMYGADLDNNPNWNFVRLRNLLMAYEIGADGAITTLLLNKPNG